MRVTPRTKLTELRGMVEAAKGAGDGLPRLAESIRQSLAAEGHDVPIEVVLAQADMVVSARS